MSNMENQNTVISVLTTEVERQNKEIERLQQENSSLQSCSFTQDKYTTYLELTRKIAYSANLSANAEDAIRSCMISVCEFTGWEIAHSFYINRRNNRIESSGIWHTQNDETYHDFKKISETISFSKGEGLPGRVYKTRKPAWISDIGKDDNFPRIKYLKKTALKAGLAFPVMYGDNVMAILEFFSTKPREPDQEILDIMAVVGLQLGRALEREEAAKEFHASNEQLMGILNIAPAGIITIDTNQRIKIFNPGAEATFGYSATEVIGKPIDLLIPKRFRQNHKSQVKQFGKSKSMSQTMGNRSRVFGQKKNGVEFPASASISKLILEDTTTYLVIIRDISHRVKQEKIILQAKEEAETANRAKSEFLANMSHELRTPLNAISGFSEVIKDQMFGSEALDQYAGYAGNIYDSSQHLLRLINDILDLSAVESGKIKIEPEYVEPYVVLNTCMRLVEERARQNDISLKIVTSHGMHDMIHLDPVMLKQIIINLLTNAVKYNKLGGSIVLNSTISEDNNYIIEVEDTGIGIAPENMKTALTRFGKIGRSFHADGEGTGLGLTLCNELAEAQGGSLTLESKVNIGTKVTVTLPLVS